MLDIRKAPFICCTTKIMREAEIMWAILAQYRIRKILAEIFKCRDLCWQMSAIWLLGLSRNWGIFHFWATELFFNRTLVYLVPETN